jgi:hypothetical protein
MNFDPNTESLWPWPAGMHRRCKPQMEQIAFYQCDETNCPDSSLTHLTKCPDMSVGLFREISDLVLYEKTSLFAMKHLRKGEGLLTNSCVFLFRTEFLFM